MIEAYPLHWPENYPRSKSQKDSRFITTPGQARDFVKSEVQRIGGKQPIISTNVPLKADGDLRADWSKYKLDDTGVAVYFTLNGNQVCLCCDSYKKVWDNLKAVGRTIAALRQIDRDGVSDFLNRAFTGFKQLPSGNTNVHMPTCWEVLGISPTKDKSAINSKFRELSRTAHPDAGGDANFFDALVKAKNKALELSENI